MLRMNPLALALAIAWGASPALAAAEEASTQAQDTPEASAPATQLSGVTVTATRTERAVDDVPATVTVTSRRDIDQRAPRNLKDLLDDEVDLSVRAAPTRFTAAGASTGRAGVEGINIRGLEGNQVLMAVDGIRVPEAFTFASFSTGRGDYVESSGLKAVEVLRGPASTQFGSDGLAGAVSLRTLDPSDLLKGSATTGGFARVGYASVDDSWSTTLAAARRSGGWQWMLLGNYRRGHETDNRGSNDSLNVTRTAPNPLDYHSRYVLGKAVYAINDAHQLGLSLESLRRRQNTDVFSARARAPLVASSTLDLQARDAMERNRVSLEHQFHAPDAPWVQRAQTRLYWQDSSVNQLSIEDRNTLPDRTRDNTYSSKVVGFSTLLESHFTAPWRQRVSYGLDYSRASTSAVRDGTQPPRGESFPTKPFPDTTYTLAGAFLQNEMELGALSVIPGVRFDHYSLKPSTAGYSGGKVVRLSDQAVSPRLGVVWRLSPHFAPYAQWAKGFRAPTPDQVNNGFSNLAHGYVTVGNAELKAERARSVEVGARGTWGNMRYAVALFDNHYDNFISQQVVGGRGTPANPMVFQYINLADAHIRGADVRAEWAVAQDWTLNAGLAYARGDSTSRGEKAPLDSINPLKATLGLRYDNTRWGANVNAVYLGKKSASRVNPVSGMGATAAAFIPPSALVVDVGGYYKPQRNITVTARIGNLFNKKYWRWSDVRGLESGSPVLDAYTAAGRNVQLSFTYEF